MLVSIDSVVRSNSVFKFVSGERERSRVLYVRRMTSVKSSRPLKTIIAQCRRRSRVVRTRTFMEEGRCATCEALGRRSLSTKLLQVATTQAHIRTCSHASSPESSLEGDLATRALAAKRRKSIAGFKLNFSTEPHPIEPPPKPTATQDRQPRSLAARRNTWCS